MKQIKVIAIFLVATIIFAVPVLAVDGPPPFQFGIDEATGLPKIDAAGDWATEMNDAIGTTDLGDDVKARSFAWNLFYSKYRGFIFGLYGMFCLTSVAVLIISFMKLGASAGNPQARQGALMGIFWSGCGIALLGSLALVFAISFGALKEDESKPLPPPKTIVTDLEK